MRIVVTGPHSLLGQALLRSLAPDHQALPFEGDVRDEAAVATALNGADAVMHLAHLDPPSGSGSRAEWEALDVATRGTYVLLRAAAAAGVQRVVLGSALSILERYPAHWHVTETWRPLPDVRDVAQLSAHLAEESARHLAHVEPLQVVCLRFGQLVDDAAVARQPYDPRWLHVQDAAQAVGRALAAPMRTRSEHASDAARERISYGWWVFHIPGGGAYTRFALAAARGESSLGYAPQHGFEDHAGAGEWPAELSAPGQAEEERDSLGPLERIPSRPIRNVVVFGAGGPLAAAAAPSLAAVYRLRLTDVRPLAAIVAEGKPQSPGAPLPQVFGAPHEVMQVDVTDAARVLAACEGMDAIVNCTVVRPHPVLAFLVNTIGAYHVMRAAVHHRIRRVVHTGPLQVLNDRQGGYAWDPFIPDDAPPRPGSWLYLHSKALGQEIVRLFAEQYDLEVPALLFCNFVNPATPRGTINPMTVSWEDAGHAIRHAVETPGLPSPFEPLHILADLPHGKYSVQRARQLLGWTPRDDLSHLWTRRPPELRIP